MIAMPRAIKREPRYLPWYPEWTKRAACAKIPLDIVDDIFFNYGRNAKKIARAKGICGTCPVIRKCYQANREIPSGIFYGMTAIERWRERGYGGYPNTSAAYSYFEQFFGKFWSGKRSKGPMKNGKE